MKIRKGFVSNSSSSSFIIEFQHKDELSPSVDGEAISFKEYCDEYLSRDFFGDFLEENIDRYRFVDDNTIIEDFYNDNIMYELPLRSKKTFNEMKKIVKNISSFKRIWSSEISTLWKEVNKYEELILKDIKEILYPIYKDKVFYVFWASDNDRIGSTNKEEYYIDAVSDIAGFKRIINQH